jgi:hypothetical protein
MIKLVCPCRQSDTNGRFLSGGIILGSPLSCTDLFLYTITLPAASCVAPPTLSYTTLELASRVLLSTKKPALILYKPNIAYYQAPAGVTPLPPACGHHPRLPPRSVCYYLPPLSRPLLTFLLFVGRWLCCKLLNSATKNAINY